MTIEVTDRDADARPDEGEADWLIDLRLTADRARQLARRLLRASEESPDAGETVFRVAICGDQKPPDTA